MADWRPRVGQGPLARVVGRLRGRSRLAGRRPPRRDLIMLLVGCVVLTGVLLGLLGTRSRRPEPARAGAGLRAARLNVNFAGHRAHPFRLVDARGGTLSERQLRGRPYAITFLYTHCRDTCPLIGAELRRALSLLGSGAGRVAVVGVSVDPPGDTRASASTWLRRLQEPSNFHYLVGTQHQLAPLWNAYFVDEQRPGLDVGTHTSVIYLVDPRGTLRGVYNASSPIDPHDLAHDLRVLLAEARGRPPRSSD